MKPVAVESTRAEGVDTDSFDRPRVSRSPNGQAVAWMPLPRIPRKHNRWRVWVVDERGTHAAEVSSPDEWVGGRPEASKHEVLLLLPASSCLAATIPVDGLPKRNRRQAMIYRFEEQLPLDVEQLAVAEIASRSRRCSCKLIVGVEADVVEPNLRVLEDAGFTVAGIVPEAVFVASGLLARDNAEESWLQFETGDELDLFEIEDWNLRQWDHFSSRARLEAHQRLNEATPGSPGKPGTPSRHLLSRDERDDLIAECSKAVLAGSTSLPLNLASGRLQPRGMYDRLRTPLLAASLAAALLFGTLITMNLLALGQHKERAEEDRRSLERVFVETFPDQRLPSSILSRLHSEARRAQATRGGEGGAEELSTDVLGDVSQVVASLPGEMRFRIDDLRLDQDSIYLAGEARSHADAERIAQALRRMSRFDVAPARTERRAASGGTSGFDRVLFTITASARLVEATNVSQVRHEGGGR